MKLWLSVIAALTLASNAYAADYRVIYSPSLELEVYIDDVASNAPTDWCKEKLALRIVTSGEHSSNVLQNFLPRVGKLLQSQCSKLTAVSWQLTNKQGMAVATGSATQENDWQPKVFADGTAAATNNNASPLDLSQPANTAALPRFDLPGGCHFRTWWDDRAQTLFIPDDKNLRCAAHGWLEGATRLTLNHDGKSEPLPVTFFQGYPLANILSPEKSALKTVTVNNQRMLLGRKESTDSWLLLPFNKQLHVWEFKGTLLVKMDKQQAEDTSALKKRIETLRQQWSDVVPAGSHLSVMLVNDIHPDLADPAIGAWRTLTD